MNEYGLPEDDVASLPPTHGFRADERIVKTLLLAALVPTVGPMKSLTVRRLADLNHGSIATPVPGAEKAAVLGRLRKWAPDVPELQFDGDDSNPTVSLQLAGVDVQGILDRAAEVDNDGARRGAVRTLLADALGLELGGGLTPESYTWVWRGSRRTADIRFANVRNPADIPDSELRASDRRPRLVIDFPFDDPDHGPTEDLLRIGQLVADGERSPTVCWLPLFFTEAAQERLGRLVILDHVLAGDRFDGYTVHLSPTDRVEARHLLRNQAEALRAQLRDVLRQSYGLETADERWIRTDLKPRDQFPTLDPTLMVRPPTTATLSDGFEQLLDQIMAHLYPAHPEFEEEVRLADLRTALRNVERAVGQRDGRVDVPRSDRKAVRKVLGPLNIATTGEAHIALSRHWRDHFLRQHEQQPGPVTVERLKAWMDHPKPMGLDDRVANLVICAYALANNRVLVHAGRPVALAVERLDPATEVITQELPSADDWKVAGERAAAIFGLPVSPLLSAASVAQLVGAIGEHAGQYAGDCRRLVHGLTTAAHRLEVASDADRIETARTARDLLEGVRSADDVEAIRLLARASIPTTPAAVARSIKTSPSVAAAIDGLNWRLVDGVRTLPRQWASQGDVIVRQLTEAFARDELATGLADAIGHAERTATELLAALAAQSASAQPQPADDGEPRRDLPPATGPIDSDTSTGEGPGQFGRQIEPTGARIGLRGAEARRILTALLDNLDHISTIDVSWSGED